MASSISISRGGQTFGPYARAALVQYVKAGQVLLGDLGWADTEYGWVALVYLIGMEGGAEVFVARDGRQFGPYSVATTLDYLKAGSIALDDQAWSEGLPAWSSLERVLAALLA